MLAEGSLLSDNILRLLKLEEWKRALYRNAYVAAVLIDLSRAFDCLPNPAF